MTETSTSTPTPTSPEPRSSVGAFGIAVADLERSVDFYTRVLGMRELMRLPLPDMDEAILGFRGGRGAAVVLMQYRDGADRSPRNGPVKLVFYVPDPAAFAAAIRAEGLPVTREPTPVPELGDAVVGFAQDPDGYTIEILAAT